jgi:nucleoid DNA-binding protein
MDQLIKFCAESTSLNESAIVAVLDSMRTYIAREIRNDFDVRVDKLGTFSGKIAPAHTGRNPRTGEPVNVPEKKRPVFKFAKAFVNLVQPLDPNGQAVETEEDDEEIYESKQLGVSLPIATTPINANTTLAHETPVSTPVSVSMNLTQPMAMTNAMMLNAPVRNWYAALPGKTIEISEPELIAKGVTKDTLVWREGMPGWEYARNIPELSYLFPPFPPLPA